MVGDFPESNLALVAKRFVLWVGLAQGFAIFVFVSLIWHVRPMSDDYCHIHAARVHGIVGTLPHLYQEWVSKYTVAFLIGFFDVIPLPTVAVRAVPLISLACIAGGIWSLTRLMLREFAPLLFESRLFRYSICTSAIFFALFATFSLQSTHYMTASIVYGLPIGLYGLLIVSGVHSLRTRPSMKRKGILIISTTVLWFLISGFAEAYTVFHTSLLGIVFAYCVWQYQGKKRIFLLGLLGAAIVGSSLGLLTMYLAPGTSTRLDALDTTDLIEQVGFLSYVWQAFISGWGYTFFVLVFEPNSNYLALLLAMQVFVLVAARPPKPTAVISRQHFLFGLAVLVLPTFATFFIQSYVVGGIVPRTFHLIFLIKIIVIGYWAYLLLTSLLQSERMSNLDRYRGVLQPVLNTLVVTVLIMVTYQAFRYGRLHPELREAAIEWKVRDAFISAAVSQGATVLAVPEMQPHMADIFMLPKLGPSDNPSHVNACLADYYGLEDAYESS